MQKMGGDRRGGIQVSQTVSQKFPSAEISCMAGSCSHSVVFSCCRTQRHSDGLFTSEYSKMRGNAQVQKFIQNLMGRKRRWELFFLRLPGGSTCLPESSAASQLCWLLFFIIIALIILYLKQRSRPGQNRNAGEGERKQQWGPLLYVAVPELSEQQVGVLCHKLCSQERFAELTKQMFWSNCKVAGRCVQS